MEPKLLKLFLNGSRDMEIGRRGLGFFYLTLKTLTS